jgi:hypothetical protein
VNRNGALAKYAHLVNSAHLGAMTDAGVKRLTA